MPEAPKNEPTTDYSLTEKNKKSLQFIEDVTSNPDDIQQHVLSDILTQNATVEYLHRHGLSGQTDRKTFKKLIPVITYEDLEPDITRIANGDKSPILSSHPISEFLTRYYTIIQLYNHTIIRVHVIYIDICIHDVGF